MKGAINAETATLYLWLCFLYQSYYSLTMWRC